MPYSDPIKRAEYKRRHYEANREKYLDRARQHYEANREQKIEYAREYRDANRERDREKKRDRDRRYRQANPEKAREHDRRQREANPAAARERGRRYDADARYGMRPGGRAQMYSDQNGRCYLCSDPLKTGRWSHVDHDHNCCPRGACDYCRRGLACHNCNLLIGLAHDSPGRLRRIAANLELAQQAMAVRMTQKPVQGTL
jgi:hypothetical protein